MKTLILPAIRCLLLFTAVIASLFRVQPAHGFTMTLQQVGSNVVANGSGAFNLSGLTSEGNIGGGSSGVRASIGFIGIHPVPGLLPAYSGYTGPTSFGSSEDLFVADASNGNSVAISGLKGLLVVPRGYVSGNPLLNSMTFNNVTLADLGVTPGTYVWMCVYGADQNFTLRIGSLGVPPPGVPDRGSTVSLLGCALFGVAALRKLSRQGKEALKALPKKLLPLTLFGVAVTSLFSVQPAEGYTVTLQQMGANVVANGSGAINLTGLSFIEEGSISPEINPHIAFIVTGSTGSGSTYGGFTGPTTFGKGVITLPNTSSGDLVGISSSIPFPFLLVPQGYVSNTALSDSMTFNNATFASLGVTPGTYVWTWGDGANQNFTLHIGSPGVPPPGVPDGGTTVSLLAFSLLGLAALRRKLRC